jgi:hypothetical protein
VIAEKYNRSKAAGEPRMKKLHEFEETVWRLVTEATEKRDPANLRQLTNMLDEVKGLKLKARKIENVVDKLRQKIGDTAMTAPRVESACPRSVTWEVSVVDITHDALSVEKAMNAGLIPQDGSGFLVQTSCGQVFRTYLDTSEKKLREQGKIREFYRGEGIGPGTRVVWTQIGPNKYSLEKAA